MSYPEKVPPQNSPPYQQPQPGFAPPPQGHGAPPPQGYGAVPPQGHAYVPQGQGQPQPYPAGYQNPQPSYQQVPQSTTNVVVVGGAPHTQTVIVQERETVNHCLHCCISLFFPVWIFVWIGLCICYGC